ncbi:Coiled-coil domain-containing protein 87 [Gonapodya sp. JEL0774]|nr:Coiled-coil domain-containing protein 87 [Gonapodya sp. JEL0774]
MKNAELERNKESEELYIAIMKTIKGAQFDCIEDDHLKVCPPVPTNSSSYLAEAYQSVLAAHRDPVSLRSALTRRVDEESPRPQIRLMPRDGPSIISASDFVRDRGRAMKKVRSSRYHGLRFNYGGYIPVEVKDKKKTQGFEIGHYWQFLKCINTDFVRQLLVPKEAVLTIAEKRHMAKEARRKARKCERQRLKAEAEANRAAERKKMLAFNSSEWNPGVLTLLSQYEGTILRDEDFALQSLGILETQLRISSSEQVDVDEINDMEIYRTARNETGSGSMGQIWGGECGLSSDKLEASGDVCTKEFGLEDYSDSSKIRSAARSQNEADPDFESFTDPRIEDEESNRSNSSRPVGGTSGQSMARSVSTEWSIPGTETDDKIREECYHQHLSRVQIEKEEAFAFSSRDLSPTPSLETSRPSTAGRPSSSLPFSFDAQRALEEVWDILETSRSKKLEMAVKYGSQQYASKINKALKVWVALSELIPKREIILNDLRDFEKTASDPARFFAFGETGSCATRVQESLQRERIQRHLRAVTRECEELCEIIRRRYGDVVAFRGGQAVFFDKVMKLQFERSSTRARTIEMAVERFSDRGDCDCDTVAAIIRVGTPVKVSVVVLLPFEDVFAGRVGPCMWLEGRVGARGF